MTKNRPFYHLSDTSPSPGHLIQASSHFRHATFCNGNGSFTEWIIYLNGSLHSFWVWVAAKNTKGPFKGCKQVHNLHLFPALPAYYQAGEGGGFPAEHTGLWKQASRWGERTPVSVTFSWLGSYAFVRQQDWRPFWGKNDGYWSIRPTW